MTPGGGLTRFIGLLGECARDPVPRPLVAALDEFQRGDHRAALVAIDPLLATGPADTALAAYALRFEMLRRLGWYHEALQTIDGAIERFPGRAVLYLASATWRARLHDDVRAEAHARAAVAQDPSSTRTKMRVASLLLSLDRADDARALVDAVIAETASPAAPLLAEAAQLYLALYAYEAAEALYERMLAVDPADPAAHVSLGTLRAWRGDAAGALAHAEAALANRPDPAGALGLRGAVRMLEDDPARALEDLDRATTLDRRDGSAAVWRCEALLRLDRLPEAFAEAQRAGDLSEDSSSHFAAQSLRCLILGRMGSFPGLPDYVLRQALQTLREAAPVSAAPPSRDPVVQLTEALRKLRGNRSYTATYVSADGALVPLREQLSPRVASKRALWRFVATASAAEALAEFDRVHAQYPTSAEPYNYRGELYLYLGDTATARRQFERALELYVLSRWAYIGLAGAAVVEGRYEEALVHLQRGIDRAGTPGPTAYAYRGEAYRGLGRLDLARADLEHAVNSHPLRIGAWVNLGLVQAAQGDEAGLQATLARLRRQAPGLVADAREGLPDASPTALLDAMLVLLRGNRASACVTYFTRDGRLRAVAPPT